MRCEYTAFFVLQGFLQFYGDKVPYVRFKMLQILIYIWPLDPTEVYVPWYVLA